ncbi:hypothetical protein [Bacillus paralicheniformis]|uniref:Uncharacterized protein n=2 Tax=Bacillus paralicheniformis TaxID=1648923 RepID=A0A7Z1B1B5_9BACI|nr:hypothetical protein [Bacillus paralicheniformis]OLF86368.1 hypothetical protein B4121_4559 [Bacillus paralicheniformis]
MSDVIYVIYYEGERMKAHRRKVAYLTKGAAKSVITSETKNLAYFETKNYYDLPTAEREEIKAEISKRFEIVEYVPKEERQ